MTPTKELAKLALVTSLDEEEDEQSGTGTDASNDTDATLVDDGPARSSYETATQTPAEDASSPSMPAKGGQDLLDVQSKEADGHTADIDKDGFVVVSNPSSPGPSAPENVASSSKQKSSETPDVEMEDAAKTSSDPKPPPLPPRRPKDTSDSVMMFGTTSQNLIFT